MMLWGLWALLGLQPPASSSSHLMLGLAVAAVLLIVRAAAGLRVVPPPAAVRSRVIGRRVRVRVSPRAVDPDAAGRPRPRAPGVTSAALGFSLLDPGF